MSNNTFDRSNTLTHLKTIIREILSRNACQDDCQVYLFGSWARGEEVRSSDIDIAIDHTGGITPDIMAELAEALEESTIPYKVDVVDLAGSGIFLADKVKKEGIAWSDCWKE